MLQRLMPEMCAESRRAAGSEVEGEGMLGWAEVRIAKRRSARECLISNTLLRRRKSALPQQRARTP